MFFPFKVSSVQICFFSCSYLKFFKRRWFPNLKSLALPNKQHAIFYLACFNNFDESEILPSLSNCKLVLSANIDVAK
jgi:hypothetical protein